MSLRDINPYALMLAALILPPRHLGTWSAVRRVFQPHDVPCRVSLEAASRNVIERCVAPGTGVSIVSGPCLTDDDHACAVSLEKYFPRRTRGAVARRGRLLFPAARRGIETMHEEASAPLPCGTGAALVNSARATRPAPLLCRV